MAHLIVFIQAPSLMIPLPSSHSSLLPLWAFTYPVHDSGPSARPEQQLHCSLYMHGLAGWTSHSTSLSPSEESLALLLWKTAKPPFASRHPQFPLRQTPNESKWLYHMLFNSCQLSLVHSPIRKLYISLHWLRVCVCGGVGGGVAGSKKYGRLRGWDIKDKVLVGNNMHSGLTS